MIIISRRLFQIACGSMVLSLVLVARAQPPQAAADDYGYEGRNLTPAQREGRDTWYFWTGGNEQFWVEMARITDGNVNLLNYVDGRRHGRRFRELGAITQPGCEAATAPDQYGLWMDRCTQPASARRARGAERHRRAPQASPTRSSIPRSWDADEVPAASRATCSRRTSSG